MYVYIVKCIIRKIAENCKLKYFSIELGYSGNYNNYSTTMESKRTTFQFVIDQLNSFNYNIIYINHISMEVKVSGHFDTFIRWIRITLLIRLHCEFNLLKYNSNSRHNWLAKGNSRHNWLRTESYLVSNGRRRERGMERENTKKLKMSWPSDQSLSVKDFAIPKLKLI